MSQKIHVKNEVLGGRARPRKCDQAATRAGGGPRTPLKTRPLEIIIYSLETRQTALDAGPVGGFIEFGSGAPKYVWPGSFCPFLVRKKKQKNR